MTLGPLRFTNASGGTSDWVYPGPTIDLQSPASAQAVDGSTYLIYAEALDRSQWEIATGAYTASSGTFARTAVLFNSLGTTAKINFGKPPQISAYDLGLLSGLTAAQKAQVIANLKIGGITTQSLTSGSGATYTTGTQGGQRATWIEVFMVGGGGGGAGAVGGATPSKTAGSDGTASSFNGVTANPGKGAAVVGTAPNQSSIGGAGGAGGTGTATRRSRGGPGTSTQSPQGSAAIPSGVGGSSYFGGGAVGLDYHSDVAGISADTNSGAGGSGASTQSGSTFQIGAGGGAGEFVYLIIDSPAASYTYTVGAGGNGGASTFVGGNGGSGFIFVIEHYGLP